jgi:hypothetical protein
MKLNFMHLVRSASLAACLWAATACAVTMSVNKTTGPAQTFDITTIRKITYDLAQTPKMTVVLTTNATQSLDIATIRSITFSGVVTPAERAQVKRIKSDLVSFALRRGFMPSVSFTVEKPDVVKIGIYTISGELVRSVADQRFDAGDHTVFWDGANEQGRRVSTGNYIMRIDRASRTSAFKFVTVK